MQKEENVNKKLYIVAILLLLTLLQLQCTIPETSDITSPVVAIIFPYGGSIIADTTNIVVESTDDDAVAKVHIYIDDNLISSKSSYMATFQVDVSPFADDQTHSIQAIAVDKSGNRGYSTQVLVTISDTKDIVPPTVSIANPQTGQQVEDTVKVLAIASDESKITEVAFFVNGDSVFSDHAYPYEYDWVTTHLADSTSHAIAAKAFDTSRNWTYSTPVTVTVFERGDKTSPTVALLYPNAGSVLSGIVDVVMDAADNVGVTLIEFYIDGKMAAYDNSAPWGFSWNTDTLSAGTHTLYVKAYDASGNEGTTGNITFTIADDPDVTSPTVILLYPTAGSEISGTIDVVIDAYDDVGVILMEFYVDGILVATDNNSPWGFSWNTTNLSNGDHSLYIKAYDEAGNEGTTGNLLFTIADDITAPTVTLLYPGAGSVISDTVNVLVDASDDVGVTLVEFYVDGNLEASDTNVPWGFAWDTGTLSSGTHILYIKAYDAVNNVGTTGNISFTVADDPDVTSPTVLLLYPGAGSVISGTVDVIVDASDDIGVSYVEFYVNGILEFTDNNSPWGFAWDTSTLPAGDHVLYIKAYDAAGNTGTTGNLVFTIADNSDTTPPTLTLLYPAATSVIADSVNVVVDAIDNVRVDSVQFFVDGVWENTDTSSPWGFTWNTTSLSAGTHTLYMKGFDPSGNIGTLGPISFIKN